MSFSSCGDTNSLQDVDGSLLKLQGDDFHRLQESVDSHVQEKFCYHSCKLQPPCNAFQRCQESGEDNQRLQKASITIGCLESREDNQRLQKAGVTIGCEQSREGIQKLQKAGVIMDMEEVDTGIHFFPPIYIQRYTLVLKYLQEHNIKSVIDFGCSECGFIKLLPTVPSLEQVALVDIDKDLLEAKKSRIKPELHHYTCRRSKPLHVQLLAGNAEVTDSRLLHYEAVTLIEVIEHLHEPVLENVALNVFGRHCPRLCVVTTPNSEFNVLFNNEDPRTFRHWDHKFEWTRQEFQQWCERICQLYGYCVEYSGVGTCSSLPDNRQLGPCSQAAIFTLLGERRFSSHASVDSQCYELIAETDFPYEENVLSLEEKIDLEVSYQLRAMVALRSDDLIPGEPVLVSVSSLADVSTVRALGDECDLRESLRRHGHRLTPDGLHVILEHTDETADDWLNEAEEYNERNQLDSEVNVCRSECVATGSNCGWSQSGSWGLEAEENWDEECT